MVKLNLSPKPLVSAKDAENGEIYVLVPYGNYPYSEADLRIKTPSGMLDRNGDKRSSPDSSTAMYHKLESDEIEIIDD